MHKLKALVKNFLVELLFRWQKSQKVVAPQPSDVHLSVTENCCLQCKMCDIWKIKNRQKNLDYQTAIQILDKLQLWLGNCQLTFAGGEPFLNRDFLQIISYAKKKGFKTSTNSNGYIIDENLAKKINASGLTQIFFSIDGLSKKHNFIRGKKDSFQKVTAAIKNLQKDQTNNKKPRIFINSVISNNNLQDIIKLINLAKKMKVAGINFQVLMPNFATKYQADWFTSNPFWPKNKKLVEKTITELINLKTKYPEFLLNSTRDFKNFKKYLTNPKLYQETEQCLVGFNNCMIDSSGNMRLCYEMGVIGNILKKDPRKLWRSQKALQHREQILQCQRPCKLLPCNDVKNFALLKKLFYRQAKPQ